MKYAKVTLYCIFIGIAYRYILNPTASPVAEQDLYNQLGQYTIPQKKGHYVPRVHIPAFMDVLQIAVKAH
jgi:hypothetical protein